MNRPTATSLLNLSTEELTAYYAPPAAIAPTVQPSTDPAVYMSDPGYMKGLMRQFYETYLVELANAREFDAYKFRVQQWLASYRTGDLPAAPKYVAMDPAKYDAWFLRYCQSWTDGVNAPAYDFIVAVPALDPPLIVAAPPPPMTGSPIGPANGAGIFMSGAADSAQRFGDLAVYYDATSGHTYQKHMYITPFGVTVFWFQLS